MSNAERFDEYRPLMFSIAYRMLGSVMEAEDIVQEAYLRWQRADTAEVESAKSYLSAVVTRLCIDQLRSARMQRETYIGAWLPEPLIAAPEEGPANMAALSDSLSMAFLVLLESLSPEERAVFLLREVFDYPYAEIALILGKTEAACRQLFTRARQHVSEGRPRFEVTREEKERVTSRFIEACTTGDLELLVATIAGDAVLLTDSGGKVSSARRPVYGADHIARFILGLMKKAPDGIDYRIAFANSQPALITYVEGTPINVMLLQIAEGRITAVFNIRNPDKLRLVPRLD